MSVLILHISDIHIQNADDPILSRASQIASAACAVEPNAEATFIVVSGDISNTGTQDEYRIAERFLLELISKCKEIQKTEEVHILLVPGNHDCNFADDLKIRASILPLILQNPELLTDKPHRDICLGPQSAFQEFDKTFQHLQLESPKQTAALFAHRTAIVSGKTISFYCLNSAALTVKHEMQAHLAFPVSLLPSVKFKNDFAICIYHHPLNWFESNNARIFRKLTESLSDLILTGHEHEREVRDVSSEIGKTSYFESGPLQERKTWRSQFLAIAVDLQNKKERVIRHEWRNNIYVPETGTGSADFHAWRDIEPNSERRAELFTLRPEFDQFLKDLGVVVTYPTKEKVEVGLSDLFVFPELRRVNGPQEKAVLTISSDNCLQHIFETPKLFITGDDQSGRTSLSKTIFVRFRERGDVPIYIDANTQRLRSERISEDFEAAFKRCYREESLNNFRQTKQERKVAIIDNFHRASMTHKERVKIIDSLRGQFNNIIILSHDTALTLNVLAESLLGSHQDFAFYAIRPFSYPLQERLIEKWLMFREREITLEEYVAKLDSIRTMVATVFGKNYVPAYPVFIIAILQGLDAGSDIDPRASTHGYFYEVLIKQSLAEASGSMPQFNVLSVWLGNLAFEMHKQGAAALETDAAESLHNSLQKDLEVLPRFTTLLDQLLKSRLLRGALDSPISFRHPYIYYYFLATFLSSRLDKTEYQEIVKNLSLTLHKSESAGVMIFLAHVSKDRRILDSLIQVADQVFATAPLARLENEACLTALGDSVKEFAVEISDWKQSRPEQLSELERQKDAEIQWDRSEDGESAIIREMSRGLKTLQVLGQFLKNFPADLVKSEKDRVIDSCCNVSARILGRFYQLAGETQEDSLAYFTRLFAKRMRRKSKTQIRALAARSQNALLELATFSMIARISAALGSRELIPTYQRYFSAPADNFKRLSHIGILLSHFAPPPTRLISEYLKEIEKQPVAHRALQWLVARYFKLFPTPIETRQKLGELLGLKLTPRLPSSTGATLVRSK